MLEKTPPDPKAAIREQALALGFDALTGNPDHVTSTFVAVLSVSPVVLMGLKRSLEQVCGSLLGGVCGTAAALAKAGLQVVAVDEVTGFPELLCHELGVLHVGTEADGVGV